MEYRWELAEDSYIRKLRLVRRWDGLIVGGVTGRKYDIDEWNAYTDDCGKRKSLGRYVTEAQAKKAVESAQPKSSKKGKADGRN